MAELLLTVEQAAERLQLHPESVRRQLKRGLLRGIKRGSRWRVPESAIEESTPIELQRHYNGSDSSETPSPLALPRPFEFSLPVDAPIDYEALFVPPTPEEIKRRLEALATFIRDSPNNRTGLPQLSDDAVAQGYEERADELMR